MVSKKSNSISGNQARAKKTIQKPWTGTDPGANDKTPEEIQTNVDRTRYDQAFGAGAYDRMKGQS
ncbi:hypothetical protein IT072_15435 [Leifsonia sp. ZF2019]|uniref:hypothetical protein n=1 Tax=Leifsonia sp. ZF2019 TaxID=2781978 RepID=UPI001CBAE2EA|nr:hypothetical protein [Leifsonia sp. ZF2019]UAJ78621.1 hypothetical protein IT072_15435 [Leifsonia sp. ZF2019]